MKSKKNRAIIKAVEKNYSVIDGSIYRNGKKLKSIEYKKGYNSFGIKMEDVMVCQVPIHRFVAYKKFGNKIFDKKIEVRHLDSDSFNNYDYNIGIGSRKDNSDDKSPDVKIKAASIASKAAQKHNHEEILKLHKEGVSYNGIMDRLNITSKGTISFIIKQSIKSKNENI